MSGSGRFLIATWDGGGNTPPAFNLGARLVRQGYEVRLLGWASMARRAAAAGLEFAHYPSVPSWPPGLCLDDEWEERAMPALHGTTTRDDIVAEARQFAADVLVLDCMLGAGFSAAEVLGLPTAVLVHVMYASFRYEWGQYMLAVDDIAPILDGAGAVLALTPPGFDKPCALPANTTYVGPIMAQHLAPTLAPLDTELLAAPGDPWVLLSLSSTVQGQAVALPSMLDALARLPVRVLLTLGGVLPISAVDAPPNVTVRGFLPHEWVLPQVAAVVCHGGLSTVMAALAFGVPLVCIPQGREQPDNARQVEAIGVGRFVAADAPSAEVAAAVDGLLKDDAARREARRLAEVIAGLGGGRVATEIVVGLLDE